MATVSVQKVYFRYAYCSDCVSGDFPCDWCVESHQCVAGTHSEDKCRAQHIINGVKVPFSFESMKSWYGKSEKCKQRYK